MNGFNVILGPHQERESYFKRAYDTLIQLYIEDDQKNLYFLDCVFLKYRINDLLESPNMALYRINNLSYYFKKELLSESPNRFDKLTKIVYISNKFNTPIFPNHVTEIFYCLFRNPDIKIFKYLLLAISGKIDNNSLKLDLFNIELIKAYINNDRDLLECLIKLYKSGKYGKFNVKKIRQDPLLWTGIINFEKMQKLFLELGN